MHRKAQVRFGGGRLVSLARGPGRLPYMGERLLALPPGRWNEMALMDWLCAFIGGGSNLDVPLREMPDYYRKLNAPRGETDLIFVTAA